MLWCIALKDISAFLNKERKVFFGLLAGMVTAAFILNYSYSFARFRGEMYDQAWGSDIPIYRISSTIPVKLSEFEKVLSDFKEAGLPETVSISCRTSTADGKRIAGTTEITPNGAWLTGTWTEGYAVSVSPDDKNACAVSDRLLSYDGRLKMTDEVFTLDSEEFIIRGVYETFAGFGEADIVIFLEKYKEKYGVFNDIWITFDEHLSEKEQQTFENLVKKYVEHGSIHWPQKSTEDAEMVTRSHQLQYSIFIVLLVVFLASILQYWYDVNLPAYTVYWLIGAKNRRILGIVFCETLLLCGSSYVVGLLLNAVCRLVFTKNAPLTISDMALGFGIFFGTMLIFGLINMVRLCRTFSVSNIRRE